MPYGFGINNSYIDYSQMPWLKPAQINFNAFNGSALTMPGATPWGMGWTPSVFGGASLSPSSNGFKQDVEGDTFEERQRNRAAAKAAKEAELMEQAKAAEEEIQTRQAALDDINQHKQADGSVKKTLELSEYKKQPWWKKALRAGGNMIQGVWKLAMNFAGYENGKFSIKKCLKNLGVAALCIGASCIPGVGPFITTALLATGVVSGAVGVGKGIYKVTTAETVEDLDHAFQDIGAGAAIGITSALGLRGLGKGLQAANATGTAGSVTRSIGRNGVEQFVKDMTINAYRATAQSSKAQFASVRTNGWGKTYLENLKALKPASNKEKFENLKAETIKGIDDRIGALDSQLNGTGILSPETKAILEQERAILEAQKVQLNNSVTQKGWKSIGSESESHKGLQALKDAAKEMETNGFVEINGQRISMNENNLQSIQNITKSLNRLADSMSKLSKLKASAMKSMSLLNKYKNEINTYTGNTKNSALGRYIDVVKANTHITLWSCLKAPFKLAFALMAIPFKPWNYVSNTAAGSFYKIEQVFIPEYESGLFDSFTGDINMTAQEVQAQTTQLEEELKTLRDAQAEITKQRRDLANT